jgi:4-amino-4-deoxy-L-arabinose transferase-like glycosyltransferase
MAAKAALGARWWLSPLLAALCLMVTAWATHGLAHRLGGERLAQLTVLLWGLHLSLTWRAVLYNHNTVLIALVALMFWAAVCAAQDRSMVRWLVAGACAGLACLSKYQAAIPLLMLFVVTLRTGLWHDAHHRAGMLLAAAFTGALLAPHALWLWSHDLGPLRHASAQLPHTVDMAQSTQVLSFLAQQIRFFWPALLAVLLAWLWLRKPRAPMNAEQLTEGAQPFTHQRIWMQTLVWGAPVLVLAIGAAGTYLQNHWGLQTFQFAALGLALVLVQRSRIEPGQLMLLALPLHAALAGTLVYGVHNSQRDGWDGKGDRQLPARALAQAAVADWRSVTACPLNYVVGWSFEAGTVSVFSGQNPQVLESGYPAVSPWVDMQKLKRDGALYMAYAQGDLPAHAARYGNLALTGVSVGPAARRLHWAIVPPTAPCSP